jgi:hypothetical protein
MLSHSASTLSGGFNPRAVSKNNGVVLVRRGDAVECSVNAKGSSTVTFELFTLSGALAMRRVGHEKVPGRYAARFDASGLRSKVCLIRANIDGGRGGEIVFVFP